MTRSRRCPFATSPKRARRPKGARPSRPFSQHPPPPRPLTRPPPRARAAGVTTWPWPVMRGLAPLTQLSRRRRRESLGAGQQPRPRALRQGNAVAYSRLQDAVAALARKIDALDAVSRRKPGNEAREA